MGIAQYFPVLGSIGYWAVIPNTNTAWTPIYQLSADDCREIGEEVSKARVLANEGTQNEMQQAVIISFYNIHGYFNSHSMGKLVLYTC